MPALRHAILILLLAVASLTAGCARAGRSAAARDPSGFPFSMLGQDTRFRIDLHPAEADATANETRELLRGELCYLTLGSASIECFSFGSLLVLGPDDVEALVSDNPLEGMRPWENDLSAATLLEALSAASLIGASVERLPAALADYMDSDGDNQAVAAGVARRLLEPGGMKIPGMAGGGRFSVSVEVTEVGRRVLADALRDSHGNGTLLVNRKRATRRARRPSMPSFSR